MKEFPPFRLDTGNQCLWRQNDRGGEDRVPLKPTAFAILRYLVDHAGRLVTHDELLEAVWPDTNVEPDVLKRHIFDIRNELGDDPKRPRFIETLPRRGYQFMAFTRSGSADAQPVDISQSRSLVGRSAPLRQLNESLRTALRGQRQIVFVTGEPGIGKTSLVDDFQHQIACKVPLIHVGRGQCVEGYGGTEAYYSMLEAIGDLCRRPGGDSIVRILATKATTWLVQFPALVDSKQREMLQREILGATRGRMLREIGEALETATSEMPLLLVLEDLHWADPATVDVISALARSRAPCKLMLIATYRPVDLRLSQHPLKALKEDLLVHRLCKEIPLEPLQEADVADYLSAESGGGVPEGLAELIYRRTEGNPLFMVATLEHMIQRALISRENGVWKLNARSEEIDLEVPESLIEMIEGQINRLSTQEQRLLEVVSLDSVGSRFSAAARAAIADLEPDAFEDICERLSRRHCILHTSPSASFSEGTVSACYEFVHSLYRDVCYERIPLRRRASLHLRMGQWAEANLEHPDETAAWLADHFERGEDWLRAVKHLRLAAETAGRRFAPREAAAILEHALELLGRLPDEQRGESEIEVLEKRAKIYLASFDLRALETYQAMASVAARHRWIDAEVRALIGQAHPLSWFDSEACSQVLERALQVNGQQEDPVLRARRRISALVYRLWVSGWNPRDAEECRTALTEIQHTANDLVHASLRIEFSFIQWISSEYREAHWALVEGFGVLFQEGEENPYLNAEYFLGQLVLIWSLMFLGEWGEALREIEAGIALMDKNGDYFRVPLLRCYQAWLHLLAMDFAGALAILDSVAPWVADLAPHTAPALPVPLPSDRRERPERGADVRRPPHVSQRGVASLDHRRLVVAALAETSLGHYDRALEYLMAVRHGMNPMAIWDWYWRMMLEAGITELWLTKGDLAQARVEAERFLKTTLATNEHAWQALAWEANARVAMAELDLTRAQHCITTGLSTIEGLEVPLAAWRVHATASELYQRMESRDLADHHREISRSIIRRLADSLGAENPLRQTFLSATMTRKVLSDSNA